MTTKNLILAVLVSSVFVFSVCGQKTMTLEELRNSGKKKKAEKTEKKEDGRETSSGNVEYLMEGSYSGVEEPFVFVARDNDTYRRLAGLVEDLDADRPIDFVKFAVVAAFSGEKSTGGYSVKVKEEDGKYEINDVPPPHGAIVTQALTTPFAVVEIPVEEENSIQIGLDGTWSGELEKYSVLEGSFEFSGGFLGRTEKFAVVGTIGMMRHEDLFTLFFDLKEQKDDQFRILDEAGSGIMKGAMPSIHRIEGGNFIDRPHPPLMVTGKIEGGEMSLNFLPGKRGYVVNDGFEGKGWLKAELMEFN